MTPKELIALLAKGISSIWRLCEAPHPGTGASAPTTAAVQVLSTTLGSFAVEHMRQIDIIYLRKTVSAKLRSCVKQITTVESYSAKKVEFHVYCLMLLQLALPISDDIITEHLSHAHCEVKEILRTLPPPIAKGSLLQLDEAVERLSSLPRLSESQE